MRSIMPKHSSVLGLDIGEKRIGLAYSDALNITVSILPALKRSKNLSELNIILKYITIHNIRGIIAGLPLDEKGLMTNQAFDCKNYGDKLFNELKLPYAYVNEHSSTWESINRFGLKRDKTGLIDSLSAKIILEQWIREGPELKEYVFNTQENY